jgi:hypothetical protein
MRAGRSLDALRPLALAVHRDSSRTVMLVGIEYNECRMIGQRQRNGTERTNERTQPDGQPAIHHTASAI